MKSYQRITRSGACGGRGAVAAARYPSVQAAIGMLEAGGNAIDAAVAAAFVAGVVEPMETTLAGSGFMLVGLPGGQAHSVEFGPRAPKRAHAGMYRIDTSRQIDRGLGVSVVVDDENVQGAKAAGVPATLAGLARAQGRFGRLALATVMAPAIRAAYDGFECDSYFALEALDNLAALRADPGAAALFLRDGVPPVPAHLGKTTLARPERIRQPALGRTLESIAAHGIRAFYEGELGVAFLRTHRDRGGLLEREDLLAVAPAFIKPRTLAYRDARILAPCAPCGAVTELQILNIWQALYPDPASMRFDAEALRRLAEASWHAFADRYHWLGDSALVPVPEAGLLSQRYADSIAQCILRGDPPPRASAPEGGIAETPWNYFARHAAHDPWAFDATGAAPIQWAPQGASSPTAGTTHVSVTDNEGMSVAITHTAANHCGAKVVCERTGLLLDAAMGWFNACPDAANSIAGGKRPLANMGPVLLERGGRYAAIGAPGGRRIIDAVVQVVINLVDRTMDAEAAISAPRIDASGTGLLYSERLRDLVAALPQYFDPALQVDEQHQGYGYELARPLVALHDGAHARAAIDPFSRGYAEALL
ncbi:gamma-glutamyltransferase [Bordetella sp. BOR01]|uniref:gamma-glutamyltransferase n=1 Tax=Bordetella sp. BOR01 TaxID=2854779 RepID=UPI001C441954|nr:gamma-glutamyltransferase [Bordetella sp. BOR01]MBV7485261.1 gamma-glutamyltransferase family protein [Bordetella sp. BOR01]